MAVRILIFAMLLQGIAPLVLAQENPVSPRTVEVAAAGEEAPAATAAAARGTIALLPPSDPEECLNCHRFRGLARLDKDSGELRLFFCSDRHYALQEGPHTRLLCSDCHDRESVEVVPHDVVPPVDCTTTCHLSQLAGAPVQFSHEGVEERLNHSAHDPFTMNALPFEDPPLREGQSACLYCHDQPVFRDPAGLVPVHRGHAASTRCQTCHNDELPKEVDYYLKHTAGRLQAARPILDTARVCAACHSDPKLREAMGLHDAVSSYFRSFHGKASLLGNDDTATCVDCHRTEEGDVHLMQAANDPDSRTFEANRPTTCRTVACHPNAVPEMSDAAVHLRMDPQSPTLEYLLMAAFVILTLGTMTVYFALVLLELLNAALRSHTPEHRKLVALARAVLATRAGKKRLLRLTVHQRFQHWALVTFFVLLVLTGMPMKFATVAGMGTLAAFFGGLAGARLIHHVAGVLLLLSFAYHVVYLVFLAKSELARRRVAEPETSSAKHLFWMVLASWMIPTIEDVKQFGQLFAHLLGFREERPHQGRFHFSQKFEYLAVFWGVAVIGSSGIVLWSMSWVSQYIGGRAINFALIVHSDEAFLALIYIAVVHFFAVIFSPAVFPLHTGSLTGAVPAEELAENHAGHLLEVAEDLGIEQPEPEPEAPMKTWPKRWIRRAYALSLTGFVGALGFVSLSWLVHELFTHAPIVEVEEIPVRLDAAQLTSASADGEQRPASGAAREGRFGRSPMAHFHVVPAWYSPDPANTCTEGGCHEPLPHGERKEDRAFLNMHTTFVDCQVCHLDAEVPGADVRWVTLADRSVQDAPAVLRLAAVLERPLSDDPGELAVQDRELRAVLQDAVRESGGDSEFSDWLLELGSARLGGVLYRHYVDEMRRGITLHGHGEYGAKLGLPSSDARLWTMDDRKRGAADRLQTVEGSTDEDARQAQVDILHEGVVRPEVSCTSCHTNEPDVIDFAALGYSPGRARSLESNATVEHSQAIERGEPFYLPKLLSGPAAPLSGAGTP